MVDTFFPFVIVLWLNGQQFIGTEEYADPGQCETAGVSMTANTTTAFKCIPNYTRKQQNVSPDQQ